MTTYVTERCPNCKEVVEVEVSGRNVSGTRRDPYTKAKTTVYRVHCPKCGEQFETEDEE